MTPAATMPRTVRMRPVTSANDGFLAAAILADALIEDIEAFEALVPPGTTPKPVEIAEDESVAVFDVHAGTGWDATTFAPIARIIVRR